MGKHIAEFANELSGQAGFEFIRPFIPDDGVEIAKQIIDILAATKLPICLAVEILEFCKQALQLSEIQSVRMVKQSISGASDCESQ